VDKKIKQSLQEIEFLYKTFPSVKEEYEKLLEPLVELGYKETGAMKAWDRAAFFFVCFLLGVGTGLLCVILL
jgi:hypothetical protein